MPLSGAYYYPVAQAPNSSFPNVTLREVANVQSSTGLGKLFVSGSDLYYIDQNGTVQIVAGGASDNSFFNNTFISGTLMVSGSTNISGTLTILTGSSQVLALGFGDGNTGFYETQNDILNLNTGGSTRIRFQNTSVQMFVPIDIANQSIRSTTGHLILSSSVGSIVRVSGSTGLLSIAVASLPAGSDVLSGSVVWVSDRKCAAIYGPLGWTRIVTGTL